MDTAAIALHYDEEFIKVTMPVEGVEYSRPPSPPPSEHSSQGGDEEPNDKQQGNSSRMEKKERPTHAEYINLRNENYKTYLKDLEIKPPKSYCLQLALVRKKIGAHVRPIQSRPRPVPDDVTVNFSDTSCETNCTEPRNHGRALESIKKKCEVAVVDQRKQQITLDGESCNGVLFNHVNFHFILEAMWKLIKMTRMEQILKGEKLDRTVDLKWLEFEQDFRQYYGPMDTESEYFKRLFVAFQIQRWEMITDMFQEEAKMMEKILEHNESLDFSEQLATLRKTRSKLELKMATMSELRCDQNPYTNPDKMDFWVMPRPKQTIKVYRIHHEELEDFLDFRLSVSVQGEDPKMENALEKRDVFVREGYNPAVFDVGWHYSVEKIYGDAPWKDFFPDDFMDFEKGSLRANENFWGNHLLRLRGELMTFNPFGVEETRFFKHLKGKFGFPEDDSVLGNYEDSASLGYLSDLAFSQKLASGSLKEGDGNDDGLKTKTTIILFDSQLEGVIVTPREILDRVKTRIRFLIDEQPNHLLRVSELEEIYESCFGQKFFPLQWGYKDMEDFLQKEVLDEDVVIVEKDIDESEMEETQKKKTGTRAEIQKEVDLKWKSNLENGDGDDDDDEEESFDYNDLFAELIHEGPWVSEGEVYRVVDQ